MDKNMTCAFFLAANSKDGFVSFFEDAMTEVPGRDTYLIKSGPGCGKGTAIGRLADGLYTGGLREDIYCSSDPRSLDGVILHSRGAAIFDGTAPHVTEPSLPGADGDYIALSAFRDTAGLRQARPALRLLQAGIKDCYTRAYGLLTAVHAIDSHITATMEGLLPEGRLEKRARGVAERAFPKKGGVGRLCRRFIDGVTPEGYLRLYDSLTAHAERVYDICSDYGLTPRFLTVLLEAALAQGHTVYACFDPIDPRRLLHLWLPALSLAFVTSDRRSRWEGPVYRRIRLDGCMDSAGTRESRRRARRLAAQSQSLLTEAVACIEQAHAFHDRMEAIYHPHIDFDAVTAQTDAALARMTAALNR